MATASLLVPVTGRLLDTTRETGSFIPDGETTERSWDYTCLHLLIGREVVKVRLPKGVHTHNLKTGTDVTVRCEVPRSTKFTADHASIGLASADTAA